MLLKTEGYIAEVPLEDVEDLPVGVTLGRFESMAVAVVVILVAPDRTLQSLASCGANRQKPGSDCAGRT